MDILNFLIICYLQNGANVVFIFRVKYKIECVKIDANAMRPGLSLNDSHKDYDIHC